MPSAARRPCSQPGCSQLAPCQQHPRQRREHRPTAARRGYGAMWVRFRKQFVAMLVSLGIMPACGAALPDGPATQDSACKAEGMLTTDGLHLDHEPPLTEAERSVPSIVCDSSRVQLLCEHCHSRKTRRQERAS